MPPVLASHNGNGVIFDRVAQMERKGNHASNAMMRRERARNRLDIDIEYGIGRLAGPVFSVLWSQKFFSYAVKSSRESVLFHLSGLFASDVKISASDGPNSAMAFVSACQPPSL